MSDPVVDWLQERQLQLRAVLQTHHHADHIGGTPGLLQRWPDAAVVAAAADRSRIPFQTISVSDGDQVRVLGRCLRVLDVAAHTSAHIAFVIPDQEEPDLGTVLFCGDTLFSGGCGRLFEGTPADMHRALKRLSDLPESTKVCCTTTPRQTCGGPPSNPMTLPYGGVDAVVDLRRRGELSLPSSIGEERRSNLFMRAESAEELGRLRREKDQWRAA